MNSLLVLLSALVALVASQKNLGGPCVNGSICPSGWTCTDGHCLPLRNPSQAKGACKMGVPDKCPWGQHCLVDKCYTNPDKTTAIGPCVRSLCPDNYYCFIGECVKYNP